MGKNLRGNIVRCSDSFSEFLTGFVGLSGTKIDDLNLVVLHTGFKKNVFGLQIAMDNLMGVAIGHAGKKLLQKNGCVSLIEFAFVNDFVEEFTTLNVISDDVEALVVLEVFVTATTAEYVRFNNVKSPINTIRNRSKPDAGRQKSCLIHVNPSVMANPMEPKAVQMQDQ